MKTGEVNYIDIIKDYESRHGLDTTRYHYDVRQGRGRYNKVTCADIIDMDGNRYLAKGRRAAAFIDRTTGHVFKAASWSKPARTRIA